MSTAGEVRTDISPTEKLRAHIATFWISKMDRNYEDDAFLSSDGKRIVSVVDQAVGTLVMMDLMLSETSKFRYTVKATPQACIEGAVAPHIVGTFDYLILQLGKWYSLPPSSRIYDNFEPGIGNQLPPHFVEQTLFRAMQVQRQDSSRD